MRFKTSDGGEGPAWAAWGLVLNGGHESKVVPFVSSRNGFQFYLVLDFEGIGGWAVLGGHELVILELFKSQVREVVDALGPSVPADVVISDLNESFSEDLEAIIWLDGIGGVELTIDFFDEELIQRQLSVEEISVLDV